MSNARVEVVRTLVADGVGEAFHPRGVPRADFPLQLVPIPAERLETQLVAERFDSSDRLASSDRRGATNTSRPSGSRPTARTTPNSRMWFSGACSLTSLRATSARAAPSPLRVTCRLVPGRLPMEASDAPSRWSPIGSRRCPHHALPRRWRRGGSGGVAYAAPPDLEDPAIKSSNAKTPTVASAKRPATCSP